jgi:Caspase domain
MARKALLIGLDVYSFAAGRDSCSPALANLDAFSQVLHSSIGQFQEEDVETLINPDDQQMRQAIERLSSHCRPHDVRLLYICGLGLVEWSSGQFYLPGYNAQPERLLNTALSTDFICGLMDSSHCRNQLILLDVCWAAPEALLEGSFVGPRQALKGAQTEPLLSRLATSYRAVLLAQNPATGWVTTEAGLSEYTHCLTEGIDTGLADVGADGFISVADLQQYLEQSLERLSLQTQARLQAPAASAEIQLFKLPQYDPEAEYRRSVEEYVTKDQGQISDQSRQVLNFLRAHLGLVADLGQRIEAEVLRPFQERQERLQRYETAFAEAIALENPPRKSMRRWLRHLQHSLALSAEEVTQIEARHGAQTVPFGRPSPRLEALRVAPVVPLESDRNGAAL